MTKLERRCIRGLASDSVSVAIQQVGGSWWDGAAFAGTILYIQRPPSSELPRELGATRCLWSCKMCFFQDHLFHRLPLTDNPPTQSLNLSRKYPRESASRWSMTRAAHGHHHIAGFSLRPRASPHLHLSGTASGDVALSNVQVAF